MSLFLGKDSKFSRRSELCYCWIDLSRIQSKCPMVSWTACH